MQQSSPQTASDMESSERLPLPFRQDKYTLNSEKVKSENENNDEIRFSDKSINRCFLRDILRDMPGEWFGFCLHFGFHNVVGHIKTVAYVVIFQLYHCKAVAGVALYSFGVLTVHVQTHPAET